MQLTLEDAGRTGFAILAIVSGTALCVGACSSSHDEKSPASSSSPVASKGKNKDSAQGTITSVSGNAVQVTANTGTSTVDVSPPAKVSEYVKAQLTDLAVGNCVRVFASPAPPPGGAPTAAVIQVTPLAGDGKCQQSKLEAAEPNKPLLVVGPVDAVEGNSIKVTVSDANGNPSPSDVSVTDKTQYSKNVPATLEAVAKGKCINAVGTLDGGGKLQASFVTVAPATGKGECPQPPAKQQAH